MNFLREHLTDELILGTLSIILICVYTTVLYQGIIETHKAKSIGGGGFNIKKVNTDPPLMFFDTSSTWYLLDDID